MKKTQRCAAILVAAALAFAGCAAGPSESTNGKISLTYWDFIDPSQDSARSKALAANIGAFEAANPDVDVNLEVVSFGDMLSRLPQAAAAGGLPDVIKMYSPLVPKMSDAGVYQSIATQSASVKDWLLPIDGLANSSGAQIAVPYEYRSCALLYNTKILRSLNIETPTTWKEVVAAASAATKAGHVGFGTGFSKEDNSSIISELFDCSMTQLGQEIVDGAGKASFATEKAKPFAQLLSDLKSAGALSHSVVADQYTAVTDGLSNGTMAMAVVGTHRIITVQGVNPDVSWTAFPSYTGDSHATSTFGWTLGIGASSQHAEAAWRFINYMTGAEAQTRMASGGEVPVRESTYDQQYFSTDKAATVLKIRDYLAKNAKQRHYPLNWLAISNGLAEAAQGMYLNGTGSMELLESAQAAANK